MYLITTGKILDADAVREEPDVRRLEIWVGHYWKGKFAVVEARGSLMELEGRLRSAPLPRLLPLCHVCRGAGGGVNWSSSVFKYAKQ